MTRLLRHLATAACLGLITLLLAFGPILGKASGINNGKVERPRAGQPPQSEPHRT